MGNNLNLISSFGNCNYFFKPSNLAKIESNFSKLAQFILNFLAMALSQVQQLKDKISRSCHNQPFSFIQSISHAK